MEGNTIYPFGAGGQTPSGVGLNAGTFAEAFDLARLNNYIFGWFLLDVDKEGNPVNKMIWHISNGKFVDAIGAEFNGTKNGLTIECSENCYLKTSRSTERFALSAGENNFSFSTLGFDSEHPVASTPVSFTIYEGSTGNNTKYDAITGIDFGGMILSIYDGNYAESFSNITYIKRLKLKFDNNVSISSGIFRNMPKCSFAQIATYGTQSATTFQKFMSQCPLLTEADLSGFDVRMSGNNTLMLLRFYSSESSGIRSLDIRDVDTSTSKGLSLPVTTSLKKLTIGNLDNSLFSSKIGLGCTGATLICTTANPPKLKNCAFDDTTPLDEYSDTNDWVAGHFSAIYVPDEAVDDYKSDVYVTGGKEGKTGWSKYANIILPMSQYNG